MIHKGDDVKITNGPHGGMSGRVIKIKGKSAKVQFLKTDREATISLSYLASPTLVGKLHR